jgi:hypothetical protein
MAQGDQPLSRQAWVRGVGFSAAAGGLVVLGAFAFERWSLEANQDVVTTGDRPPDPFRKFQMPGIDRPPVVEASNSKLRPDEEVIGFVVGGKARAYRLDALRDRSKHLVNDVVGDVPVSVVFCDIADCVQGYTGQAGQGPLGVSVAGLFQGREMVLEVGGQLYFQKSGQSYPTDRADSMLPLERIEPTRTTWECWKLDHPETDVYEGIR